MKKTFYSLIIAVVFSLGSLCAYGAEATAQAIVLKVKGAATVVFEGQTQAIVIKVGDKLPQGATIVTGPNSEIDVQTFNGAVATVKADSTISLEKLSITTSGGAVTKQTALLNLKVGSIVSNIDPANHNINDYSIRTPKGVAAARGTIYTVIVSKNGAVQVFVTQSVITFTDSNGKVVIIQKGYQFSVNPDGTINEPTEVTATNPESPEATKLSYDTDQVIVSPMQ